VLHFLYVSFGGIGTFRIRLCPLPNATHGTTKKNTGVSLVYASVFTWHDASIWHDFGTQYLPIGFQMYVLASLLHSVNIACTTRECGTVHERLRLLVISRENHKDAQV